MASLARSAAAYREGAASSRENRPADFPFPPLPGCETTAAHRFEWRGENASPLPQGTENYLSFDYQRFEKRMKASKPLQFYRRRLDSCVERSLPNGLWLDGFSERGSSDRARSVDVLITWPKTGDSKPPTEERELTVEILCVEAKKSNE